MHISNLPESEVVIEMSDHIDIITGALQNVFGLKREIGFEAKIEGGQSGLIFSTCGCLDAVQRPKPLSPWLLANVLWDIGRKWQIRKAIVNDKPVAIALHCD
jgi:hypothetical protein